MKISLKWLQDYVDVADFLDQPEPLAEKLTAAGIEVEGIERPGQAFAQVVVGKILLKDRHPDADKLTLCQVDVGQGESQQIICGASNHQQGDKVVVALPGAVLPGDFKIKVSKIRGVESRGMLCSASELGLDLGSSEGIVILPEEAPVGEAFAQYRGLEDVIFELSVTPNRADCLSHLGLAREIGSLLERPVRVPSPEFTAKGAPTQELVSVEVKNSDLCPRYAGRVIRGVKVGPSPDWLRQRLESVGLNSINNVVDVTNFVMMELGQPLHAFDVAKLRDQKILVAESLPGELFITLDKTEISLKGGELMIRDGERPVALAGVVGGLESGVSETTQDLFVESAHFVPETVRKTARSHGIETDSAYRFSRGTDPEMVKLALDRACELIQKTAGGEVAEVYVDHYPAPLPRKPVAVNVADVSERLGYEVSAEEFQAILRRLGCRVEPMLESSKDQPDKAFAVVAPAYRWDLFQAVDFIEEVARVKGYDLIPEHFPPLHYHPSPHVQDYSHQERLANLVAGQGYYQAVNYGFISSKWSEGFLGNTELLKPWGVEVSSAPVPIQNPLNADLDVMRVCLLPGLFKNLLHNYRHSVGYGRLFELGSVFSSRPPEAEDRKVPGQATGPGPFAGDRVYSESPRLALLGWGQVTQLWSSSAANRPVVYDLKSHIEAILSQLRITQYQWLRAEEMEGKGAEVPDFLHPGQSAALVVEGRALGFVGSLHPLLLEREKLRSSVAVAELDVAQLMRGQPRSLKVKSLSRFPAVERDLTFVLPQSLSAGQVLGEIKKAAGANLQSARVVDVFTGGDLKEDQRAVSYRMLLQSHQETLSEELLQGLQTKVIEQVKRKLAIEVR